MPEKLQFLVGRIVRYGSLSVLSLVLVLAATNFLRTRAERSTLQPPGKLVDVLGTRMHVHTTGSGTTNVVLLSGLGTLSPAIDFQPLVRELNSKVRVTVVEYPGYGWSQDSDRERSTSTSVEEIRLALRAAGVAPPYVLVAHSISGLQALYYANHYPGEIAGVVGLDSSLPAQLEYFSPEKASFNVPELLRVSGIVRLVLMIKPEISGAQVQELTPREAVNFATITNWNFGSHAIWNESNRLRSNFESLAGTTFPRNIPITLVLATESLEKVSPEIPGAIWLSEHRKIVAGNPSAQVIVMQGPHYIHHGNARRIAGLILEVVAKSAARPHGPSSAVRDGSN